MRNRNKVWAITLLVGGYIMAQAIADIGATKMIDFFGIVMPAGSLMFAVTFTLRDLLHKRLGKDWALAAIITAAVFNVIQSGYLAWMGNIPAPPFFQNAEAWSTIFALVPSITFASILAELISQLIDTEVYDIWMRKLPKAPQWMRVLVSNAISLPIDSFIFGVAGFMLFPLVFGGDALPFSAAMQAVVGQIYWKAIITVLSMPLIYAVKEKPIDLGAFAYAPTHPRRIRFDEAGSR